LCLITPFNDYCLKNTYLYGNHLPIGGLFLFSLLALLYNPLARRFCRRLALGSGDLLVFWAMATTGAGLASSGLWRYLGPGVVAPAYFANSGAKWLPAFDSAPSWLLLSHDPQSPLVIWFYQGLPYGQRTPWAAWMPVLAGWGVGFLFVALFSMSVSSLFRKQWVERERLTYPLVQLPLQVAVDSAGPGVLARSRALWAGCAVVIVLHGASTLHHFVPSVPQLLDAFDIRSMQQTPPWNALGMPLLEIFLAVIGVIFLLPADVAYSLWFTYLALHVVRVIRAAMGYDALMHGPLDQESAMGAGAFLVIAAWLIWLARDQLALGGLLTVLMAALRARLVWWPLGPIGLAMASTYAMDRIYFSVFLGWLFKAAIARFGGLPLYRKAVPFFLGLVLGEWLFGGMAAMWGLCFGVSAPPFLPD
jgi:hypothetical protein